MLYWQLFQAAWQNRLSLLPRRLLLLNSCSVQTDYPAACNSVEKLLVHHHLTTDGRLDRLLAALKVTTLPDRHCSLSSG